MEHDPPPTLVQAHPWHGVSPEAGGSGIFQAFVEIVPTDTVKYELDKVSGHLRIDRPQLFSSFCPTLYGFIPQTYCGDRVAARCSERTGIVDIQGDNDPWTSRPLRPTPRPSSLSNALARSGTSTSR